MEAESPRIDIKIKLGQTVILLKSSPGLKLDILDHAHGINPHENSFLKVIAIVFGRQSGVREADFALVLKNIHPGFFGVGQIDC